jgi:DNA polymerase elongation subunit (family B)
MSDTNFYTNVQHYGNYVLYRGVVDGKRFKKRMEYKPRLYTAAKRKTEYMTLYGQPLEEIQFDSINDCKDFKKKYQDVPNFKIYGDNRHEYSFISDFFQKEIEWNISDIVVAFIDIEVGSQNGFPEPEQAFEPVTAITIHVGGKFWVFGCGDFVTTREDIVYTKCADEKELIKGFLKVWTTYMPDIVTGWYACRSLINGNPDPGFDFSYLINRMERLFMGSNGEDLVKTLSPWGWVRSKKVRTGKGEEDFVTFHEIAGVAMIDYIDLYKKFSATPSQEAYTLNYISSVEVGEKKIDYSEYEDLHTLYLKDYQKFIEYNIHDVDLVRKIDAKNGLIEQIITLSYDAKVNYEDVFSQVRMWDTIIMNELKHKGIMMPPKKVTAKTEQFSGGYVKEPKPAMYKFLASFDFKGLYPHLIMMFNLSPETLLQPTDYDEKLIDWMQKNAYDITVDGLLEQEIDTSICKEFNLALTPNKQLFRNDIRGFLPEIMDRMVKDRDRYKKQMIAAKKELEKTTETTDPAERERIEARITKFSNLQSSKKIQLNSAFGAVGNEFFRFYDIRIAEAITMSAQLSVRWIQKHLNAFINKYTGAANGDYVIASDTDSVYVTFETIVNKAFPADLQKERGTRALIQSLDKVCQKVVTPQIEQFCMNLKNYTNAYEQRLEMKREALVDKAIWVKKKNYMLNIWNMEGVEYAKPKLKITGMAAIKSSTPSICRAKVKEAYELIMNTNNQNELREFCDKFKEEFFKMKVQDISAPLAMNHLDKYDGGEGIYKAKTPPQTKGALVFNMWLKRLNLTKKYQLIKEGGKLKYVYLKQPNPLQSDVVSFTTVIPKEFGIDDYIDYEAMYEKNFLVQITRVTDVIGWQLEEISTLEHLFG